MCETSLSNRSLNKLISVEDYAPFHHSKLLSASLALTKTNFCFGCILTGNRLPCHDFYDWAGDCADNFTCCHSKAQQTDVPSTHLKGNKEGPQWSVGLNCPTFKNDAFIYFLKAGGQ